MSGRSGRGFSLIEIMISSSLFFIGLTAILSTYNVASDMLRHHRHMTRAIAIAEGAIEEAIQRYPGDPALSVGDHSSEMRKYDRDGVLVTSNETYQMTWVVESFGAVAGIRAVHVTVRWQERNGPKFITLTTWRS